ncbi:arrestin domain-containing protein 1-like isoform X2 [Trichoplusia ni]|nr:arrestin domain-containing protein 1-like isoform X2 [Trichoplusia ni]
MKGFCKVHWTTSESRRVNNRTQFHTVNHDSYEEYFNNKVFIFGDNNGEHHLQPGTHDFKFQCHIPANCPSSYEGEHGHIRYRIKVVMVTSGMFSLNKEKKVAVRVHAPLDLNLNPYCKEPLEYELLSSFCCWCMSAGSAEVRVRLPVSGYCPGQVMPMEVNCKNPSSVDIDKIKFAIKKDITFTATSVAGTRYDHDTVAEITKGPVPAGTTRNWTVEMEVPSMDVYNVDACRFIDITYTLKISTEADGCHENSEDIRPIIFGTVPLVGYQDNVQNPLHDQLPNPIGMQNVPAVNCYPPPPIMNQPLSNSPYPNPPYQNASPYPTANPPYPTPPGNLGMPNVSPYPSNTPYSTTPNLDRKSPYPGVSPYPAANPPYPVTPNQGTNPPYPVTSPNQSANTPYPGANPPYPNNTPNPGVNPPYPVTSPVANPPYPVSSPAANSPYPPSNSPYPPASTPYNTDMTSPASFKTGTLGFTVSPLQKSNDPASVPLLPPGANPPYPSNPYASASAPEPSTPGSDQKTLNDSSGGNDNSPYNPSFIPEKQENHN